MKNVESDRDSFLGRLLAETLEAHGTPVTEESCLDAETLAAWADDTLGRRERASAEAHAASCARCQALLAVMMKTAPPAVAEKSAWRIPALGWLIPLTAAAAALLVWAIVPRRATLPVSDRPVLVASDRPVALPGDRPLVLPDHGRTLARSAPSPPPPKTEAQPARQLQPSRAPAAITSPSSAPRISRDLRREEASAAAVDKLQALEKSTPAAAAPPAAQSLVANATNAAPAFRAVIGTVIVSSSQASRWRIVPGGTVERSTDGGSTWQAQETGATVTLVGGASPSPSVCWLVGRAGTVLLSTDGRSWQRVAFPEAADLISVRATDEKIAAVTTLDGRTFSTRDGGLTWVRSGGQ